MTDALEPDIVIYPWLPENVIKIIGTGSRNFVGLIDGTTVLKYPQIPPTDTAMDKLRRHWRDEATHGLDVEEQMLLTITPHPRIVGFKGRRADKDDKGLLLEYMPNGAVADHLKDSSTQQKFQWMIQAGEAVTHIHSYHIFHCDLSVGNLLLDIDMNIKLADFQGKRMDPDGTLLYDGGSCEDVKYSMPDRDMACPETDIFALGSTMYLLMTGKEVYSELSSVADEDQIGRKFKLHEFPHVGQELGQDVIYSCWRGDYKSAQSMVADLTQLMRKLGTSFIPIRFAFLQVIHFLTLL